MKSAKDVYKARFHRFLICKAIFTLRNSVILTVEGHYTVVRADNSGDYPTLVLVRHFARREVGGDYGA